MAVDQAFVDDITRRLDPVGNVTAKRMFGGVGLFVDGKMFAKLTSSGALAFKADDGNRAAFEAAGMSRAGKMPYFDATADQLEDDAELVRVAALAVAAALR